MAEVDSTNKPRDWGNEYLPDGWSRRVRPVDVESFVGGRQDANTRVGGGFLDSSESKEIKKLKERVAALERWVADLDLIVTQPQGSVRFLDLTKGDTVEEGSVVEGDSE